MYDEKKQDYKPISTCEKKIKTLIKEGSLKAAEGSILKGVVVVSEGEMIITVFHKQMRMRA